MKNRINQIAILGLLSFLMGCGDGALSGSDDSLTGLRDGVTVPTTSGSGVIRLRCEKRSDRSKISLDANNIAAGSYSASVTSNGITVGAPTQSTVGDEVEFDFDSETDDIAAGAVAISADFIEGGVLGALFDANGNSLGTAAIASCPTRN